MFRKLYTIIPAQLRAKSLRHLAVAVVGVLLDLLAVVGFVPLLAIIANPRQITSNSYLHALYQWSDVDNQLLFTLLMASFLFCVLLIKNVIMLRISYAQKRFMAQLFDELSVAAFKHTYSKGLLYIRTHNSNKLINEIGHTTLIFATMVIGGWMTIISECFMLMLVCILVFIYSPILFVALLLVFVPFALLYTKVLRKKMQTLGKQENELRVSQYRTITESLRGYTDIKLTGSFGKVLNNYRILLEKMAKPRTNGEIFREMPSRLIELVVLIGIIVLISVNLMWSNDLGEELMLTMGIFVVVAYKVMPAINRILAAWSSLHKCDFATAFCSTIACENETSVEHTNDSIEHISVDNITFAFPDREPVITDLSIRINRGERVVIRGASGCGKSTLLHIILGFYQPDKGKVTINDHYASQKFYPKMGYVSQEIFIMDDTLLANITMQSVPDMVQFEKVWQWAGLDTLGVTRDERLREWGSRLSGGQRQRIAIARALYRNSELLILDEATSALDQIAEKQMIECLDALPDSVTIICVAHRPVNKAWRVIELN